MRQRIEDEKRKPRPVARDPGTPPDAENNRFPGRLRLAGIAAIGILGFVALLILRGCGDFWWLLNGLLQH